MHLRHPSQTLRVQRTLRRRVRMLDAAPHASDHATLRLFGVDVGIHSEFLGDELFECCGIPSILDVILASCGVKYLYADFDPSFAEFFVSAPETQIVFATERKVVNGRIQVVDPSIPNLFSGPPRKLRCEVGPLGEGRTSLVSFSTTREASATGEDYSEDNGILLFSPLSFSRSRL